MQLHQLQPHTKQATRKRVGRGGKRGKTSGRGMKGQKARAGHRIRPEVRDTIKKLPKMRGRGIHPNKGVHVSAVPVNISALDEVFASGETVTPQELVKKNIVRRRAGRAPTIKILGTGSLSKKLTVTNCAVSESVRKHIEAAGGSIT